jgi:hypothetical protein
MAKKYYHVNKKVISLEEYKELYSKGARRPFCKNGVGLKPDGVSEIVRVELKCKRCSKIFTTLFSQLAFRSCFDLCTECINHYKRSEANAKRDKSYYENEDYRKKLSEGVKRYYREKGSIASKQRELKRIENFRKNGCVPDNNPIKITIHGIKCVSFGEGVFVKWMISEGYSVRRCNVILDYEFEGKLRHYFPDFIIEKDDQIYLIEVKSDYRKNFQKSYDYLQNRVTQGLQKSNPLVTYREDILCKKIESAEAYCKKKGWIFKLMTLDDSQFNLLYNRAKRLRRNGKTKEESIDSIFR